MERGGEGTAAGTTAVQVAEASYAEKLKARLDYLEDWYFRPHAYETKISQWEVKELRTHRPYLWKEDGDESKVEGPSSTVAGGSVEPGSTADNGALRQQRPTVVVPKYFSKQADLAVWLHGYFRERITLTIDSTRLGLWRKGIGVGQVVIDGKIVVPPPFPNKNEAGNRWVTQECINWIEQWIVPQKAVARTGQDADGAAALAGNGAAVDLDRIKQEDAIWWIRRNREKEEGKFKSVEVFNQHIAAMFSGINRALNAAERQLQKGQTPEEVMEMIRAEIVREVNAAKETDGGDTE